MNALASAAAVVARGAAHGERAGAQGQYHVQCHGPDGKLKWEDDIENTVMIEGANFACDQILGGTAFVACYMGLISSVSFTAISGSAGDTMAQLAGSNGWREAGTTNAPQWTTPASGARGTPAFGASSGGAKSTSAAVAFSISTSGTIKGCFIVIGTGAVATNLSTAGRMLSAGLFTGGDKAVGNGDTLSVTYSLDLVP
jgi:hypothetical protein